MSDDVNADLLAAVKLLTERIESLETEIKGIKLLNAQNVPEETVVAIAAATSPSPIKRIRAPALRTSAIIAS